MNFKRNLRSSLFLFFGICLILFGYFSGPLNKTEVVKVSPSPTSSDTTFAKVVKVFDGDTIQIDTGQKVRYIGIDTTEVYPKIECYSLESKAENEKLVLDKTVRLEKDVSETDKYGRLLRYVYIDDKLVNDELVKNGYAKVFILPPDEKFKAKFLYSEKHARNTDLGLWRSCGN